MKTYELSYIISPEVTSEEALAKSKEIELAVQNREGVILKQLSPVAKTLAYPVEKRASGFLGVLEFQMEPEKLIELKEIIEKDGKIVRHMVIIKEIAKIRKERRSKIISVFGTEQKSEEPNLVESLEVVKKEEKEEEKPAMEKEKVELKDIDQQLDEILGE